MKALFITALVSILLVIPAIASELADDAAMPTSERTSGHADGPVWDGPKDVLYDNGPIVTSTGTGVGGADESIIDASESTNGFGCQWVPDIRLSDDFTVPPGETWEINSITLFGYQTGYGPPSTLTGVYIEIWDGSPQSGTQIWGDLWTNRLTTSTWMNCYRVNQAGSGSNTDRPIMANVCDISAAPISLTEGTYWMCWQMDGWGDSGPWNPPITINGQLVTGNAIQFYTSAWQDVLDTTSGNAKGLPFILEGSIAGALENGTWASIKTIF